MGDHDLGIEGLSDFREIGSGGFAVVYSALEVEIGRRVAVKVLGSIDDAGRRRFDRERLTMGQTTDHPNIVTLFRSGYTDSGNKPYMVMEYLAGGSLHDRLEATGAVPWTEAIELILPIADALGYSHRAGIVHKDVKPANILISSTGMVKLSDFGIAAVRDSTATSQVAFSMLFTAPESFTSHRDPTTGSMVDPRSDRSDLYSLAATLYTLGTGIAPFHSINPAGLMHQILTQPVPPSGDHRLDAFFARAMAKDPAHRHPTAAHFIAELHSITGQPPAAAVSANQPAPAVGPAPIEDRHASSSPPAPPEPATIAASWQPPRIPTADPPSGPHPFAPPPVTVSSHRPWILRSVLASLAVVATVMVVAVTLALRDSGTEADGEAAASGGASGDEASTATSGVEDDDSGAGDTVSGASTDTTTAARPSGDMLGSTIPCDNQHEGKVVTILSSVRDSADYIAGYEPLMECTGLEIDFQTTNDLLTEIDLRLADGDAPDVIDYPLPGPMADHARRGHLFEFPADLAAQTNNDFITGWEGYATVDGTVYGIPGRSSIGSLIWYSPSAFAEAGYESPGSIEDLTALSDQIVTDGGVPWCIGAESGSATGWVLTDWIEDFMLRLEGEDAYDRWISNELAFNDPKVVGVVDAVGTFVKNPDYLGGENAVKAVATTSFQDGGLPILSGDCHLHRQASFYSSFWPEGTEIGPNGDVNFFYLPSPAGGPRYMLGAGYLYAAGTDKPETFDVLRYTGSPDYQLHIVNTRSELSPNLEIDLAEIDDPLVRQLSELQASADVFRFDASDLMPGAVGAGTFWTEVTAWVIGGDTQTFVDNVQASWPSS